MKDNIKNNIEDTVIIISTIYIIYFFFILYLIVNKNLKQKK